MKRIKKIAIGLVVFIALIAIGLFAYTQFKKPEYEGEITFLNVAQKTEVFFDEYGIPHIYANSQEDALRVLGYVHAQDRLWQMEVMRRIAPGRLSELFGSKALQNDRFFAGLGIDENSEKAVEQSDKNAQSYKLAMAYLEGVNQYIEQGKTPIEFELVGAQKEKYTLKDVYNIFGFMSFSFAMAQKTDPLLTDIRDKLGNDYLVDLGLDGSFATTRLKSYQGKPTDYAQISKSVASLLDNSPIPPFIGSNSWVIGAEKTKNGKVIFANDPHIGFSQPCTWYEAHIVCPDYEMYGYYLAGTPFPLLGHNRKYAYGLTMFENDDLDLFREKTNPENGNQYFIKDAVKNFEIKEYKIGVKDSTAVSLKVKQSIHGPVLNGLLAGFTSDEPVAMSWIYLQEQNRILEAVYGLSHATSLDDFHKKIELIHAPGLNVMYGDADNNIAWITSGKLYKMPSGVNPNFILDGSNDADDKKEFIPFEAHPYAINPPWHYVYSSNNQPEAVNGYLYPGYYLPKDRATRISTLLESKNNWTATDVQKMINDNTSAVAPELMKNWLSLIKPADADQQKAIEILKAWKGSHGLDEVAPVLYNRWIYRYLKNTFEDELGAENFSLFLGTHIMKQTIAGQSQNPDSPWWDNQKTPNKKETRAEILNSSFAQAIADLQKQLGSDMELWQWRKVHTLEHEHPIGKVAALRSYFNVGPFEAEGTNEVINNLLFPLSETGYYNVKAGPSTRRIIDFYDVENSVSILPTGQSGVPSSPHYDDQAELYMQGKFRKMKLNKKEIMSQATKMTFLPGR